MRAKAIIIEHIGNTSIEGLGAKSILDIMIGVHNFKEVDSIALQSTLKNLAVALFSFLRSKMTFHSSNLKRIKFNPTQPNK